MHEPNEYGVVTINGDTLTLKLNNPKANYLSNQWIVGVGVISTEGSFVPEALATPINYINVQDSESLALKDITLETPIVASNQYYCVKITFDATTCTDCEYLGKIQPRAIAYENNPESPFYVGTSTQYTSEYGNVVDFADPNTEYITDVTPNVSGTNMVVNVSPWCTTNDFNIAPIGTTWKFKLRVNKGTQPIVTMSIIMGGLVDTYTIANMANQRISLDYSQDYLLIGMKISQSTLRFNVMYYPMPASVLPMSTTSVLNLPKFDKQVRFVCAGDEYDNIYSDSLAEQRARYEIYLRARLHDNISISCVPIYWLDVNTIIEYNLPNNTTQESDLWLIKSISTDVSTNGTQSISATRYYPLYADISMTSLRMSYDTPS